MCITELSLYDLLGVQLRQRTQNRTWRCEYDKVVCRKHFRGWSVDDALPALGAFG